MTTTNGRAATKKAKTKSPSITLAQLAAGYLAHLEEAGSSCATIRSYRGDLARAITHLGVELPLSELTPAMVQTFNDSDPVTKTSAGEPKSPLTIAKTRRVLRLALVWGEEAGLLSKAPLPEETATEDGPAGDAAPERT